MSMPFFPYFPVCLLIPYVFGPEFTYTASQSVRTSKLALLLIDAGVPITECHQISPETNCWGFGDAQLPLTIDEGMKALCGRLALLESMIANPEPYVDGSADKKFTKKMLEAVMKVGHFIAKHYDGMIELTALTSEGEMHTFRLQAGLPSMRSALNQLKAPNLIDLDEKHVVIEFVDYEANFVVASGEIYSVSDLALLRRAKELIGKACIAKIDPDPIPVRFTGASLVQIEIIKESKRKK